MSEKLLLSIDTSMYEWLEEKRQLLRFRKIQDVIKMIIATAIERQEEATIYDPEWQGK